MAKTAQFIKGLTNMHDGHFQIHGTRGELRYGHKYQSPPLWAVDDEQLQALLLRVFPKLESDKNQREHAGKWVHVIYLFYRTQLSTGHVAEKMKVSKQAARSILHRVRNAAAGLRTDGKPRAAKRGEKHCKPSWPYGGVTRASRIA